MLAGAQRLIDHGRPQHHLRLDQRYRAGSLRRVAQHRESRRKVERGDVHHRWHRYRKNVWMPLAQACKIVSIVLVRHVEGVCEGRQI